MRFESNFVEAGATLRNYSLFARAWDECIELQCTPKDEWTSRSLFSLTHLARYEICVWVDGTVIGGLILGDDKWDMHVGNCMSVFAHYVLPEYRNKQLGLLFMLEAARLARTLDYSVLAYTHRKGPWEYSTIYRKLK